MADFAADDWSTLELDLRSRRRGSQRRRNGHSRVANIDRQKIQAERLHDSAPWKGIAVPLSRLRTSPRNEGCAVDSASVAVIVRAMRL